MWLSGGKLGSPAPCATTSLLSSGESMQERDARHPGGIATLGFAALGVVFGDIGTSPLYTLKTVLDITGDRGVREAVGIRRGAISGNMKVSFQAARSIG
jgi:hypothetical protein